MLLTCAAVWTGMVAADLPVLLWGQAWWLQTCVTDLCYCGDRHGGCRTVLLTCAAVGTGMVAADLPVVVQLVVPVAAAD